MFKNSIHAVIFAGAILISGRAFALDPDLSETTEVQFGSEAECGPAAEEYGQCAVREKAAALGTPVKIYESVRNSTRFALYHGSRSNSINSFLGERGNDVDSASVLIAMLRSRGIPARYAVGTVRTESAKLLSWLGVQNIDLAASILKDQGVQKVALSADKTTAEFEHAWVEALVPYSNYRGAGPDVASVNCATQRSTCKWVGLSPSFKLHSSKSALDVYPSTNFDYTSYYNAIKNNDALLKDKNPLEIYEESILQQLRTTAPGKNLEDVSDEAAIIPEERGILPNSLPFKVISAVRSYNSIAEHDAAATGASPAETKRWAKYVRIAVSKQVAVNGQPAAGSTVLFDNISIGGSGSLTIQGGVISILQSVLTTTRTTLSFRTCDVANCIRAELRIANLTVVSDKSTSDLNYMDPLFIALSADGAPGYASGQADKTITANYTNNVVGGYYLIGSGGDSSNWSQVHRAAGDLLAANDQYKIVKNGSGVPYVDANANGTVDSGEKRLIDSPAAMNALTGGLLHTAMSLYYARLTDSIRRLDALNHVISPIEGFIGIVSSVYDVDYVDGTAFAVMPGGLLIDMKGQRLTGVWRKDAPATFASKNFDLLGHILSSLEHEIWQELTGYDAISTVRGIQMALAAGSTLLNPRKNGSTDTMPASYAGFGLSTSAPSPFNLRETTLFGTKLATWFLNPNPGTEQVFDTFKSAVSASDSSLRLSSLTYSSSNGIDGFVSSIDNLENTFAANPNTFYNATFCGSSHIGTGSQLLPQVQACYVSVADAAGNASFFDYIDENQGFAPASQVYAPSPRLADQHPMSLLRQLRNNVYLIGSTAWREYVIPSRLSVGPNYRFSVYVEKGYETASGNLVSLSFIIQNMSVSAGGGYVDGLAALEQHDDTTGTVFNNEVFTDRNLNTFVNNDLVRTPSTSDPVSTVTGNMYHDETDIAIKGRGLNYSFTRTYNSGPTTSDTGNGPLGARWTHSYNMRLLSNDYGRYPNYSSALAPENGNSRTSSITYVDERGGEVNYLVSDLGASPTYAVTSPKGGFDSLVLNSPVAGQYTLTFRNGVQYIFEGGDLKIPGNTARLLRIADPYGNQLNFAYSGGKLSAVTDNLGIVGRTGLTFSYGTLSGRLSSVSDWQGRTWDFEYSGGRLSSAENPEGETTDYQYQADTTLLTTITLPQARGGKRVVTTFRYYRNNRAFDYTNALGQAETLDYDLYRKRTRVTDPRGFIREHYYDADGVQTKLIEPDGAALIFAANADGLRNSKIDGLGYKTQYSYRADRAFSTLASDTFGKVTKELDALNQATLYDYDLFDQLRTVTDKRGKVWQNVYYQSTNVATGAIRGKLFRAFSPLSTTVPLKELTYFANGNLKQQVEFIDLTNTIKKRVTTYTYDSAGLNLERVDVSGSGQTITTIYTYDSLGRVKTNTLKRRTSDVNATILDLTTSYEYDRMGRVIKTTDALGNISETVYDDNGNVIDEKVSYKRPDGSFDLRTYQHHEYDLIDRRVATTDIDGYVTRYAYDANGNLASVTDANNHVTRFEYDAMNRRTAMISPTGARSSMKYDLAGRVIQATDANGNSTRTEYDSLGRVSKRFSAKNYETQYGYDANNNLTKVIDSNAVAGTKPKNSFGASQTNEYDDMNRLNRTVDASEGAIIYTYDLLGNVTSLKDAENRTTVMVYDDLGRLIQIKDPLVEVGNDKTTVLTYDEAGNLLTLTDRNGEKTRQTYDLMNRLTLTEFLADATQETRAYDIFGNIQSIANASATYTYEYDTKNRMKKKTDSRLGKSLAWTYDPVGNLRTKTDYQGEVTSYQYDSGNKLVSLSNPQYVQVSYHYDDAGRLLDRILSSGAVTQYWYDEDNRLTKLVNKSAFGIDVHSKNYQYDRLNNIEQITDSTGTTIYGYDPLYRLLSVNAPGTANDQSYTYDKVGNRKTFVSAGGTLAYIVDVDNRLLEVRQNSVGGALVNSYFYDDNGSRIQKRNSSGGVIEAYAYDQKRRISQIAGTITSSFLYDANNYRIQKIDSSGSQKYLLEAEHLESIYDQNSALLAKYLRGSVIDEIVYGYSYSGGQAVGSNYHHDNVQSVVAQTAHDGALVQSLKFDAFGNTIQTSGVSANKLQYAGRERDNDTNLYYYRARYYDPALGRFLSEDPLGFDAGINFYAYVGNNPINLNDPSGLVCPQCVGGAVAGATVGLVAQAGIDVARGQVSSPAQYAGAIVGGGAGGFVAPLCGPTCAGAVGGSAGSATTQSINYITGQAASFTDFLIDTAIGAVGGKIAGDVVPYVFTNYVSNPIKGAIGEGLTYIDLVVSGRGVAQTQVPNGVGRSTFDFLTDTGTYVESKFGTASLSTPQRAARNQLGGQFELQSWDYDIVSGIIGSGASGAFAGSIDYGAYTGSTNYGAFAGSVDYGSGAAGGYVLYPGRANMNMSQAVYSK